MTDKSTPEWLAFQHNLTAAMAKDRITVPQYLELLECESAGHGEWRLKNMIKGNGEINLLRDRWQAERDSRQRWWITVAIALLSALVVGMAVYLS